MTVNPKLSFAAQIETLMLHLNSGPVVRVAAMPDAGRLSSVLVYVLKIDFDSFLVLQFNLPIDTKSLAGLGRAPELLDVIPAAELHVKLNKWFGGISAWGSQIQYMAAIASGPMNKWRNVKPYHTKLLPLYAEALGCINGMIFILKMKSDSLSNNEQLLLCNLKSLERSMQLFYANRCSQNWRKEYSYHAW